MSNDAYAVIGVNDNDDVNAVNGVNGVCNNDVNAIKYINDDAMLMMTQCSCCQCR